MKRRPSSPLLRSSDPAPGGSGTTGQYELHLSVAPADPPLRRVCVEFREPGAASPFHTIAENLRLPVVHAFEAPLPQQELVQLTISLGPTSTDGGYRAERVVELGSPVTVAFDVSHSLPAALLPPRQPVYANTKGSHHFQERAPRPLAPAPVEPAVRGEGESADPTEDDPFGGLP